MKFVILIAVVLAMLSTGCESCQSQSYIICERMHDHEVKGLGDHRLLREDDDLQTRQTFAHIFSFDWTSCMRQIEEQRLE